MLRYITFSYASLADMFRRTLSRISLAVVVLAAFVVLAPDSVIAQEADTVPADTAQERVMMPVDTIFNPNIVYTTTPRIYEISGITVDGAPNY